jgi:hypothetical protein
MLQDKFGRGHVRMTDDSGRYTAAAGPAGTGQNGVGQNGAGRDGENGGPGLAGAMGALLGSGGAEEAVRALPDAARTAAVMLRRGGRWTLGTTMRTGSVIVRGTRAGQSAEAIADDLIDALLGEAREGLRAFTGLDSLLDRKVTLSERMNALLDASAGVGKEDEGHPAYVRLLSELTPDEARILRLFAQKGAQPAVDVRTRGFLRVGSRLVVPGMTMIGRHAGCRNPARVPGYLENMDRLGLIRFSRETLPDQSVYDVLEAQADVKEALGRAGRGVTVRRRFELTVFGTNLCALTGLLPPD